MADQTNRSTIPRPLALLLLLVAGLVSLPVVAAFLDGESTDQLIVPVQMLSMALLGAVVGYLTPSLGGVGTSRVRGLGTGLVVGIVAAVLGVAVFFLVLGGV